MGALPGLMQESAAVVKAMETEVDSKDAEMMRQKQLIIKNLELAKRKKYMSDTGTWPGKQR